MNDDASLQPSIRLLIADSSSHSNVHVHCRKTAAAMAPKSAIELPIWMFDAPLADCEADAEPVALWKPAPEEVVAEAVLLAGAVEEALLRVAMLMVVLRGRAVPVPALPVPTVPTGTTVVAVVVVALPDVSSHSSDRNHLRTYFELALALALADG